MTDFITPEALVRQFREDSCVDCIHTDCRARRDCADELEAAAVKWAARDAELVELLNEGLDALGNDGIDIGQVTAPETVEWGLRIEALLARLAVNRLSGAQR